MQQKEASKRYALDECPLRYDTSPIWFSGISHQTSLKTIWRRWTQTIRVDPAPKRTKVKFALPTSSVYIVTTITCRCSIFLKSYEFTNVGEVNTELSTRYIVLYYITFVAISNSILLKNLSHLTCSTVNIQLASLTTWQSFPAFCESASNISVPRAVRKKPASKTKLRRTKLNYKSLTVADLKRKVEYQKCYR